MRGSSLPQRIVLLAAVLIVGGVVTALLVEWIAGADRPADPTASVEAIRQLDDDRWVVDVEVTNTGEATAEQVQVLAEVALPNGGTEDGEQVIDVLEPGEVAGLAFIFTIEPVEDALTLRAASHARP